MEGGPETKGRLPDWAGRGRWQGLGEGMGKRAHPLFSGVLRQFWQKQLLQKMPAAKHSQ